MDAKKVLLLIEIEHQMERGIEHAKRYTRETDVEELQLAVASGKKRLAELEQYERLDSLRRFRNVLDREGPQMKTSDRFLGECLYAGFMLSERLSNIKK